MGAYSVEAYTLAPSTGGADATGEAGDLLLLMLVEDGWPRAAILPVIRMKAGSQELELIVTRMAAECLRLLDAPARWVPSLALFLEQRAVLSDQSQQSFDAVMDFALEAVDCRVAHGTYTTPVWDTCSGRVIPIEQLGPRCEQYRALVHNIGDVEPDTRLVLVDRIDRRCLSRLGRTFDGIHVVNGHLLSIRTDMDEIILEFECKIQGLIGPDADSGMAGPADALASLVGEALGLSEPTEIIAARLLELKAQQG